MADIPYSLGLGYYTTNTTSNGQVIPSFTGSTSSINSDPVSSDMMMQHYYQQQAAYQSYCYYHQLQQQQLFFTQQHQNHCNAPFISADPIATTENVQTTEDDANRIAKSILQRIQARMTSTDTLNENSTPGATTASYETVLQPCISPPAVDFIKATQPDVTPPTLQWQGTTNRDNPKDNLSLTTKKKASSTLFSKIINSTQRASPETTPTKKYREERENYFNQVESRRIQLALIKNLEYVHNQEEMRLKSQLEQLSASSTVEYGRQLDKKQQALLVTKAGIGTKQRNAAVRTFGVKQSTKKRDNCTIATTTSSSSIYVSGLIPSIANQDTVKQLFEAYGKEPRITFYKHAHTGEWKGDAIVVYAEETDVDNICVQVSRY